MAGQESRLAYQHPGVLDVEVMMHGSVVLFGLRTQAAREWVAENVATEGWQWLGGYTLAVDHRFAQELAYGMQAEGLVIA